MNPILLIKLSENDKRVIIAIFLILILVFVLIGLIGSLIIRTMKWQGQKCDTLVSDVVRNNIVTTPLQLRKYARKKNTRYFIKQAWIPIILILVGVLIIIIRDAVTEDWSYNPFNINDGFGTLLFICDFDNAQYATIFGITLLADWPPFITPHFEEAALVSYFAVPPLIIGACWYLVAAQAYLARTIRAYQLSKKVFEKSLEDYNQNSQLDQGNDVLNTGE